MSDETIELATRSYVRIDGSSIWGQVVQHARIHHMTMTAYNRVAGHGQRVYVGPVGQRLFISVALTSFLYMWSRGRYDHNWGLFFPIRPSWGLAYIARLFILFEEERSHEIPISLSIRMSQRVGHQILTFTYGSNMASDDIQFFMHYVVEALEQTGAEFLYNEDHFVLLQPGDQLFQSA